MKKLGVVSLIICSLIFSLMGSSCAQNKKLDTKVLYVGHNPENPKPENFGKNFGGNPKQLEQDYQTRWPAFKSFLESKFVSVTCVDVREYKEELSAKVDVTIFDEMITPIKEQVIEYDENNNLIKYKQAEFLSQNYKHATIFIGKVAPGLGRSLGSKLDWHCFCLEGDAVNTNVKHEIFNKPVKVTPTLKMQDTPSGWLHYDSTLPKQMPMWVVQSQSRKNSDYMLGMVSRGAGFLDSPDTEYISGAECKSITSVALGRHGHLFLWGFSASPDVMTEEGKQVFANTVVYMKKYKGAELIAKKMDETIIIRDGYLDYRKGRIKLATFETYKKEWLDHNEKYFARFDELEKLKKEGKKLSKIQEKFLSKKEPVPTFEKWMKDNVGEEAFKVSGADINAYNKYIEDNREYFICIRGVDFRHSLTIDQDVKQLGVSNRKIEVLEKAVSLLSKGEQTELAKRILVRYTNEDFASAKEWTNWLKKNKSKLFFTEAGGYKWLVNTLK